MSYDHLGIPTWHLVDLDVQLADASQEAAKDLLFLEKPDQKEIHETTGVPCPGRLTICLAFLGLLW